MVPIERTSQGIVLFLDCGCAAVRGLTHPTGGAALVQIITPCEAHTERAERVRVVLKGEMVSPFVRTPVTLS